MQKSERPKYGFGQPVTVGAFKGRVVVCFDGYESFLKYDKHEPKLKRKLTYRQPPANPHQDFYELMADDGSHLLAAEDSIQDCVQRFYRDGIIPQEYRCQKCKAMGCKLWRESNVFGPDILCLNCLEKNCKETFEVDEEGYCPDKWHGKTDQIGGMLPAIPDEEGTGYWGYTSVPMMGVVWWRRLPTRLEVS